MSIAEMPESAEALLLHDEPEGLYEVVDGQIVEKPPMGLIENRLAFLLGMAIESYARESALGQAFVENLFRTKRTINQKRRPDVAFVSNERWAIDRPLPEGEAFEFVPDLAIEIISPTDRAWKVHEKTLEYFEAGVRQVWTIHRRSASIVVHESTKLARSYFRGDVLDGGDVLPGFRLAVSDLLPEPTTGELPIATERSES